MNIAGMVKGFERENLLDIVNYFESQLKKLGVKVRLGTEVDRTMIENVKPDVLIIAAGAVHDVPNIPGITRRNVMTGKALHGSLKKYLRVFDPKTLRSLTKLWMPLGKQVVILGGNIQGCQTAEFLVKRQRKVTIVEPSDKIGEGLLGMLLKPRLLYWLKQKGVTMMTDVRWEEITKKGVVVIRKDGKRETIAADTILTALPLKPNIDLVQRLKGAASETYVIGDSDAPQLIAEAIAAGSQIGRNI